MLRMQMHLLALQPVTKAMFPLLDTLMASTTHITISCQGHAAAVQACISRYALRQRKIMQENQFIHLSPRNTIHYYT
jgi:hypothetical protein